MILNWMAIGLISVALEARYLASLRSTFHFPGIIKSSSENSTKKYLNLNEVKRSSPGRGKPQIRMTVRSNPSLRQAFSLSEVGISADGKINPRKRHGRSLVQQRRSFSLMSDWKTLYTSRKDRRKIDYKQKRAAQDPYTSIGTSSNGAALSVDSVANYPIQDLGYTTQEPEAIPNNIALKESRPTGGQRYGEILGRCDVTDNCDDGQYCAGMFCYKCREKSTHCFTNGQCCEGLGCQFGYCTPKVREGEPGTFCDKTSDCIGVDSCCVLELSVDRQTSICKPMLNAHEVCGPINLFHQQYHGEEVCGPCKPGLTCMSVGLAGHHNVCLPADHEK